MISQSRGFTLLTAVILASVLVAVGLALLDIAHKQVILASSARNSQYAFYAADSVLECVQYWDYQTNFFGSNPLSLTAGDILCNGVSISSYNRSGSSPIISTFTVPCTTGGERAQVTVYKNYPSIPRSRLYVIGYNSCNTGDPRRIERGLRLVY